VVAVGDTGLTLARNPDPARRLARIYRPDGTESVLNEADALVGEELLPGFSCTLSSIL